MEQQPNKRELRGLYKNVKIPIKVLDTVIIFCLAAIVLFTALDLRNPGFTVTFDSRGGTDVPAQNQMYGASLDTPKAPTREGYRFTGWYIDAACQEPWIQDIHTIGGNFTLYAGWEKLSP